MEPPISPGSPVVVVILTFNSASVISDTVNAALKISKQIVVVDSGSTDDTVKIVERAGCQVLSRPFKNYADQRNWIIQQLGNSYPWQLHLDADEVLDEVAAKEIKEVLGREDEVSAFMIRRCTYFLGARLRFGGTTTWHLRLFKSGFGQCEDRLYDQHFVTSGRALKLKGILHDKNVGNLTEWIARHNRWSDLEASELTRVDSAKGQQISARLSDDPRERKRYYKGAYYKAPMILRSVAYFSFRYFFQLGILDGRVGFLYAFFQALWFRMLVDAKLIEKKI